MHVAAIHCRGFRNLSGRFPLSQPLAVILGANNTGKSNLVDACRALFTPEMAPRARHWISVEDFTHDGHGTRLEDELELEAEFAGLDAADQARMITCLSPRLGRGKARLRLRARVGPGGRVSTEWLGGDSEHPEVERWARDAVTFTYLHPLRDAAADLRPGRDNRLAHLLEALAPKEHDDRAAVEAVVKDANEALEKIPTVADARDRVTRRFDEMTGEGALSQHSALAFAKAEYSRIVATLRALAGDAHPLELAENGLGYNNLLYMAVLLAALTHSTDDGALRVLLVEEPEAHLHPQLQDLLMRYLETQSNPATQVIMTSHSPNFAAAAQVERVTVLTRACTDPASTDPASTDANTVGRRPADFGLDPRELAHLRRFLDVTKSALLFARGVILVEGVAEQLLVPALAERLGLSMARHGIAVVNVGGVAFNPFVGLFGDGCLPYRCAVVSDADPPPARAEDPDDAHNDDHEPGQEPGPGPDGPVEADDPSEGVSEVDLARSPRASRLGERVATAGSNVAVFLSTQTLEWDLVAAGNWAILLRALDPIRPRVARRLRRTLAEATLDERAEALVKATKKVKGEFAQSLLDVLTTPEPPIEMDKGAASKPSPDAPGAAAPETLPELAIPDYLRLAIEWATDSPARSAPADEDSGNTNDEDAGEAP